MEKTCKAEVKMEKHARLHDSINKLEDLERCVVSLLRRITDTHDEESDKTESTPSLQTILDCGPDRINIINDNIRKTLDDIYKALFG